MKYILSGIAAVPLTPLMPCAGDDIDAHCVGPMWCDRSSHFFGQQEHCLERMLSRCTWVTSLQPVPDAYVPVIKLTAQGGIDIDLTFATVRCCLM